MKGLKKFRIFRATSNSQVGKFTESQIILARSPEAANKAARKWAFELVEYGVQEIEATSESPLKPPSV